MFVKSIEIRKMDFGLGSGQKPQKTQNAECLAFCIFCMRPGRAKIGMGGARAGLVTWSFLCQQQGSPGGPYLAVARARAGPGR